MMYYRCSCGSYEAFGSMPPQPCDACNWCNKVPGLNELDLKVPIDHDFTLTTSNGIRCKRCMTYQADYDKPSL